MAKLSKKASQEIEALKEKFPCIVRWEKHMGAFNYFMINQLYKANQMKAPATAIYERDGRWHIAEDIANEQLRKYILGN